MQEYSQIFKESFVNGLRPEIQAGENIKFLSSLKGACVRKWGVREFEDVTLYPKALDFPFPQLINLHEGLITANRNSLSYFAGGDISTVDFYNQDLFKGISPGGVWHSADFYKSWLLFNGSCIVLRLNEYGQFDELEHVCVIEKDIQTGCAFHGRLFLGGFSPAELFKDSWLFILEEMLQDVPFAVQEDSKSFVYWSTIGGGDILGLFKQPESNDAIKELWRRNEFGFMPTSFAGTVLCMLPLGNSVIAYGSNGVDQLFLAQETIGLKNILGTVGLKNRGAVSGTSELHFFVDSKDVLWMLSGEGLKRLGYQEYLQPLQNVLLNYDEQTQCLLISSTTDCFILSESGLGGSPIRLTGLCESSAVGDIMTNDISVITVPFDFGTRDLKTLTTVELGVSSTEPVSVSCAYKYNKSQPFELSDPVEINEDGFARLQITAVEFELIITGKTNSSFELDYATVHYQMSARRTRRGIVADTANA